MLAPMAESRALFWALGMLAPMAESRAPLLSVVNASTNGRSLFWRKADPLFWALGMLAPMAESRAPLLSVVNASTDGGKQSPSSGR